MAKILMLSYYYPPQTSVGIYRTLRFKKYLPQFDIEGVVLSVKDPDPQFHPLQGEYLDEQFVHYVSEWKLKKLWQVPHLILSYFLKVLGKVCRVDLFSRYRHKTFLWFIDLEYGWIIPAYKKASQLIIEHDLKAIYVSCPPFSTAYTAYKLKQKTGLPLILDFRDGWGSSSQSVSELSTVEQMIVDNADALILTTRSDQEFYQTQIDPKQVHLIQNGYDDLPATQQHLASAKQDKMTLLYAGNWFTAGRDPEQFLKAFKTLAHLPIEFISVGGHTKELEHMVKALGVKQVRILPARSKASLYEMLQQADVLVTCQGVPQAEEKNTHISSKAYDYLAMGKPILGLLPAGDEQDLIKAYCQAAHEIVSPNHRDEIEQSIQRLYHLWQEKKLVTVINETYIERFHGQTLTKKLADIIHLVCFSKS